MCSRNCIKTTSKGPTRTIVLHPEKWVGPFFDPSVQLAISYHTNIFNSK